MIARLGGRAGVTLAALAYAALALGSGLDRYCAHVPAAARLVPAALQVEAARVAGGAALVRGETALAEALAARALAGAPLDARAVSLLATARGRRGDQLGAEDALRVGNLLGWRDAATQTVLFMAALEDGAYDAAAVRLDALLRVRAGDEALHPLLSALEASPAGRAELLRRLASAPQWAAAYLSAYDSSDAVLRRRAALLASAEGGSVALGCTAIAPMVEALAARAYRREAEALARRQCPALASGGLIADPAFARFAADPDSALGWRRQASGDVRVTPVAGGIEIANSASVSRLVLTQPVALAAGGYRLAGQVAGLEPALLVASLGCGQPAPPRGERGAGTIAGGGQALVASGCANEVLGLWLRPGQGALTVGALALTRR